VEGGKPMSVKRAKRKEKIAKRGSKSIIEGGPELNSGGGGGAETQVEDEASYFFGLTSPHQASFPIVDFDMSLLFYSLSVLNIVSVFQCILAECKIVLLSSRVKLLTHVSQAFLALLWPFSWVCFFFLLLCLPVLISEAFKFFLLLTGFFFSTNPTLPLPLLLPFFIPSFLTPSLQEHVFVPLLHPSMSDFMFAPFPFIMGFLWSDEDHSRLRLEDDVVVCREERRGREIRGKERERKEKEEERRRSGEEG
jgi:hypothetical protein